MVAIAGDHPPALFLSAVGLHQPLPEGQRRLTRPRPAQAAASRGSRWGPSAFHMIVVPSNRGAIVSMQ